MPEIQSFAQNLGKICPKYLSKNISGKVVDKKKRSSLQFRKNFTVFRENDLSLKEKKKALRYETKKFSANACEL